MPEVNSSTPKIKKGWIIFGVFLAVLIGLVIFIWVSYKDLIVAFLNPPERVNILVLGKGGVGHEAPDLTDTIIFASITGKETDLISLSRDIWIPEIRAKLNSAYYWGKMPLAKASVEKIVGLPVMNIVIVDFSGFKNIIDAIGGIEVEVKNSFVDTKYPVPGKEADPCIPCRYETVSFDKGKVFMNGETALKFVRSRNAEGDEGTDVARAARQQLVISAIKEKITDPGLFLDPKVVIKFKEALLAAIETDMDATTISGVAGLIYSSGASLESHSIPEGLLVNPPISKRYDNQYVFIPKDEGWGKIHEWVSSIIN